MSQLVVAKNIHGIVLVAENRTIQLDEEGNEVSFQVNRLIPLGSQCALLTAGVADGTGMGSALRQFTQDEGLKDAEDLYGAALAFLSTLSTNDS